MRIKSLKIKNYKGIASLEVDDLVNESVVVISGRNGTGKSLMLEAIVGVWTGRYHMVDRVGPWADTMRVDLSVHLTDSEWVDVEAWQKRFGQPAPDRWADIQLAMEYSRDGSGSQSGDTVAQLLRSTAFQKSHPFAVIDFLPANRLVPSAPSGTVDLAMLNVDRIEQERYQMLDQFINSRSPVSLPNVSSYLITLDYQTFLAARQGLEGVNDYEVLQKAFSAATGKDLLLPEYDPALGNSVQIQLPTGHRHGLRDLSSGEQEMLAMMYFVRRLSASGGILCIDEPEQHLHPSLQASLFEAMQGLADRAQVLVVSHSVNLINTAPLSGLLQVAAPRDAEANQVSRMTDAPDRLALMSDLGITGADLAQSDVIIVLEGDTDAQWLRTLFPVEFGRAHVLVAGSARQVQAAHETLSKMQSSLPWICVRDRDLLSDDEVESLIAKYPNLHIWPRRSIENLLLEPTLIVQTLEAVGHEYSELDVQGRMKAAADPLKDEVLAAMVDAELRRKFPPPAVGGGLSRFEKMKAEAEAYAQINTARAEAVDQEVKTQRAILEAKWDQDWWSLVNAKAVLAQLHAELGVFKSVHALVSAVMARARDEKTLLPSALVELRDKLALLLGRSKDV